MEEKARKIELRVSKESKKPIISISRSLTVEEEVKELRQRIDMLEQKIK